MKKISETEKIQSSEVKRLRISKKNMDKVIKITKLLKENTGEFYSRERFIESLIENFGNLNRDLLLKKHAETKQQELEEYNKIIDKVLEKRIENQ